MKNQLQTAGFSPVQMSYKQELRPSFVLGEYRSVNLEPRNLRLEVQ